MVEIRICPKCKSKDVELTSHLLSAFAGIENYMCKRCGFTSKVFPVKGKR